MRPTLQTLLVTAFFMSASMASLSQDKHAPPPRGFDYWQPDWMVRELWGPGTMPKGMMVRVLRHTTFMQFGVPKAYQGAKSNVTPGSESITVGGILYGSDSACWRGSDGMGSGEPGGAVSPSPALLAYMVQRRIAVDEYLLWAISDGGKQFETEMPSFKNRLSREEIWRVIACMRSGFPPPPAR